MEPVAVDHLSVAQREDLHRRAVAVERDPDHVDGAHSALVRRLPLGQVPHREEAVAVARGLLELLVGGASFIRRSSSRMIGSVSPDRNSITPSITCRYSSFEM